MPKLPRNIRRVKVKRVHLAQWFGLMVDMLQVGFSIRQTLEFTITMMPKQEPVIAYVEKQLERGMNFADAMRPWLTADLYYQLQLAEHHGELTVALGEMSKYLALREKERQQLRALAQYPLLLFGMLVGLGVVMRLYVYPELNDWQTWQLPGWVTSLKAALLGASGAGLTLGLLRYLTWRKQPRLAQVNYLCRLPIIGRLVRLYFGYYLTSNLAILVRRGLSLKEICALFSEFDPASLLYQLGHQLAHQGQSGADLNIFVKHQPCLPNELISFIGRGLTNERLGEEFSLFARLQFERLQRQTESLIVMLQPILFLIVALGILGMYLSLLLPIYQSITVVK
ncbi:type II secretion system F family protein [Lactobacillus sp. 3B(2020)]|uniref:type II secretion system F family protein n=1 Tax=Lactobacillus sp. 3B(2020) TaxID=2695882 RepID=UPI0015DDBD0E|nr:type II secretion system F family protein [Lactobacillus sp. 3B(2020)]QLL70380.1 hypothetical protein GTO83_07530 [Lactobacillus sp. 3B(2020)]